MSRPTRVWIAVETHALRHIGTILPIGGDFGTLDATGEFNPRITMVLKTDDGAYIYVKSAGHAPFEAVNFKTGAPKYGWINSVVGVGKGTPSADFVILDVWQVSYPNRAAFLALGELS